MRYLVLRDGDRLVSVFRDAGHTHEALGADGQWHGSVTAADHFAGVEVGAVEVDEADARAAVAEWGLALPDD